VFYYFFDKNYSVKYKWQCIKNRHEKQLKVFFVGGPNQRKDFHLELGEELFFMKKGGMKLIILEKGKFKTVSIQEGEVV
jgi:3-hydroxyanthranilate 3,4-dioxygenase